MVNYIINNIDNLFSIRLDYTQINRKQSHLKHKIIEIFKMNSFLQK